MSSPPASPAPTRPPLSVTASRQFMNWLAGVGGSLVFTTYQAGKLFLVGRNERGGMAIFERSLARCMGFCARGESLYVSSLYQIHRFHNALAAGQKHGPYDRVYLPQQSWITGDLDVHDMAFTEDGQLVFVNTLFGCLATLSETHSFRPLWRPPWLSKLAAEDRCHLNGLALRDGRPRYMTAVSRSDVADGWRDHRRDGGVVIDIQQNKVIASGFSMPHSPRWYRGALWLHDSGRGWFGRVDVETGAFTRVAFCPGYLRGLCFIGDYAVVGVSKTRPRKDGGNFTGLELDEELARRQASTRCGLFVVDLRSGDLVQWLRIEGVVSELYDVAFLPQVRRPMLIGFKSDEVCRMITIEQKG